MEELQSGSLLQGGKYQIKGMLGQGGFGITYRATMKSSVSGNLGGIEVNVPVAVKEFFLKDLCVRNPGTSYVSVPTTGSQEQLQRYREKFVKEARNIAGLSHPHIVKVLDVFEENGTVYYAMEYLSGGSLRDRMKQGPLAEADAVAYIRQIADALGYMHQTKHLCHYDVKPGNILIDEQGDAKLIDFGISKGYDRDGNETSSTPVGLSQGYAPIEQYQNALQDFSPQTDVYSLGATLLSLLTGQTPPEAAKVFEDGIGQQPDFISAPTWQAICAAMRSQRRERPQSMEEFVHILDYGLTEDDNEETVQMEALDNADTTPIGVSPAPVLPKDVPNKPHPEPTPFPYKRESSVLKYLLIGFVAAIVGGGLFYALTKVGKNANYQEQEHVMGTTDVTESSSSSASNRSGGNTSNSGPSIVTVSVGNVSFRMIRVDGGTFTMGATAEQGSDAWDSEKPAHRVTLSTYYMGETEVTQELWEAVMGSNPSHFKGPRRPVEKVSWEDCQDFIRRLNQRTGRNFRLPTEAEWEYAARGGNKSYGYKYAGSNNLSDVAWWEDNSGEQTHDVATKRANELGLYDMSGNVFEWCQDWYGSYSSSSQTNPTGPSSGSGRVDRGGNWSCLAGDCRVALRSGNAPSSRYFLLGLRLAL